MITLLYKCIHCGYDGMEIAETVKNAQRALSKRGWALPQGKPVCLQCKERPDDTTRRTETA